MEQLEPRKVELKGLLMDIAGDTPDLLPTAFAIYAKEGREASGNGEQVGRAGSGGGSPADADREDHSHARTEPRRDERNCPNHGY